MPTGENAIKGVFTKVQAGPEEATEDDGEAADSWNLLRLPEEKGQGDLA